MPHASSGFQGLNSEWREFWQIQTQQRLKIPETLLVCPLHKILSHIFTFLNIGNKFLQLPESLSSNQSDWGNVQLSGILYFYVMQCSLHISNYSARVFEQQIPSIFQIKFVPRNKTENLSFLHMHRYASFALCFIKAKTNLKTHINLDEKASFDQEKTRIEIPTSHSDEDEAPSTIIDTMCGSGENRIMFRLFCSKKKLLTHVTFFKVIFKPF